MADQPISALTEFTITPEMLVPVVDPTASFGLKNGYVTVATLLAGSLPQVGGPNGLAQLNSAGFLPSSIISGLGSAAALAAGGANGAAVLNGSGQLPNASVAGLGAAALLGVNTVNGVFGLDALGNASAGLVIADSAYLAAGITARSFAARFGDILNPADFNAPLNGTADDHVGINAMIAAQPATGAIYNYPVGAQLHLTANPNYSGLSCHNFNGATSGGVVVQGAGKDMYTTIAGGGLVFGRSTTNPTAGGSVLTINGALTADIAISGTAAPIWSPLSIYATTSGTARASTALFGFSLSATGNTAGASYTGSISGTTLNVSSIISGAIAVGQPVQGNGVAAGTIITAGSGSTWTVNNSQTIGITNLSCGNTDVVAFSTLAVKSIGSHEPLWAILAQSNDRTPGPSSVWGGMTIAEWDANFNGLDDAGVAYGFVPAGTGARTLLNLVCASNTAATPNSVGMGIKFGISGRNADGTPVAVGTYNAAVYLERGVSGDGFIRTAFIDTTMMKALPSTGWGFVALNMAAGQAIAFDGVAMSAATQTPPVHTMLWNNSAAAMQLQKSTLPYFAANDNGVIQLYYVGSGSVLTSGATIQTGTGAPAIAAPNGSIWLRTDGSNGSRFYINEGGGTTWLAAA